MYSRATLYTAIAATVNPIYLYDCVCVCVYDKGTMDALFPYHSHIKLMGKNMAIMAANVYPIKIWLKLYA